MITKMPFLCFAILSSGCAASLHNVSETPTEDTSYDASVPCTDISTSIISLTEQYENAIGDLSATRFITPISKYMVELDKCAVSHKNAYVIRDARLLRSHIDQISLKVQQVYLEHSCRAALDIGIGNNLIAREKANPSGFVDPKLMYAAGRCIQDAQDHLNDIQSNYTTAFHKTWSTEECSVIDHAKKIEWVKVAGRACSDEYAGDRQAANARALAIFGTVLSAIGQFGEELAATSTCSTRIVGNTIRTTCH